MAMNFSRASDSLSSSKPYCDLKARASRCVSAIKRCASGESAMALAMIDRSSSSSSSSAYAVNFGSSVFIFVEWFSV